MQCTVDTWDNHFNTCKLDAKCIMRLIFNN